jgi:hypothetical protein
MSTLTMMYESSAGMVGSNVGLPSHLRSQDGGISLEHRIFLVTRGCVDFVRVAKDDYREYLRKPLLRRHGSNMSF